MTRLLIALLLLVLPLSAQITIGREVRKGTALPATCREGLLFVNTTTATLYLCSPTGTWVLAGPGGGSTVFAGITDGMALDRVDLTVVDTAGTLYMEVEAVGGGDVDFIFGGTIYTLDCTTGPGTAGKARVALTAGIDVNSPVKNWVSAIISGATAILQAGTAQATGVYANVGSVTVADATTFGTDGVYQFQRFSESLVVGSLGALHHQREKLRSFNATWGSGANPTLTITPNGGAIDNVHLDTAAGVVKQLHNQTWPAFTSGPYYYGNGASVYEKITDLNAALSTLGGASLSGKKFNLVIWGAVNKTTGDCKLFVNLPSGSYTSTSNAQADVNNTSIYTIPEAFKGVGFLISRLVLGHSVAASGTWTEIETLDLRGLLPGVLGGGASTTSATEFSDALFKVFDNGDPTRILAFQLSGITAANTRTITIPDASGTMVLIGGAGGTPSSITLTNGTGLPLTTGVDGVLPEANLPNASDTAEGVQENAIGSEVDTGTATDRTVTPDSLAGSVFGQVAVEAVVFDFATDTATGDGKFYFVVPAKANGMNLVAVSAQVVTVGTTGTLNLDLARCAVVATGSMCSGTVSDMLSTNLTIDSNENKSSTAAAAAVIDTGQDDLATDQVIRFDVDAVHTTPAKSLIVTLGLQLP